MTFSQLNSDQKSSWNASKIFYARLNFNTAWSIRVVGPDFMVASHVHMPMQGAPSYSWCATIEWSCSWCEILCWDWSELIMLVLVVVFFRRKIVNFTGEWSWECKSHDEAQADDWPRNQSGIIQQYSEWSCYSFQDWHRRWQVICIRWIPWHFKKHNVQNAVVEVRNYNVWDFLSDLEAVGNFTYVYNHLEHDRSMDLATFTRQQATLPGCPWHHSQQKIWTSWRMRTFGPARNHPFPSMSEASSPLLYFHPWIQIWTLHIPFLSWTICIFVYVLTTLKPSESSLELSISGNLSISFLTYTLSQLSEQNQLSYIYIRPPENACVIWVP